MNAELEELSVRLRSENLADRVVALGRVAVLDSQGLDVTKVIGQTFSVPNNQPQNMFIKARRYVNCLVEKQLEYKQDFMAPAIQMVLSDFERPDPLVKGLAVREAGKIASEGNIEQLLPVITRGAVSDDPYVRKSAALAILNLFHTRGSFIEKYNLGQTLKQLVEDSNPNVAANAVAALSEINGARSSPLFQPTSTTVNNLLAAIEQTTEWAQIQILDFVATFRPSDPADARGIIARVSPRLQHANPAVVLSAIRCCLQMNLFIEDQSKIRDTLSKVVPPLVTLLNNAAPIQFVAIKSIFILLQHYRKLLSSEVSIFFCKFNDPLYMKLAKLDVILSLVNSLNVGKVIEELFDYAQSTDIEFVRKSIAALGKVCLMFESAADSCVDKLVQLISQKVHYVLQECIVVCADIFRRYPGKYEGIIAKICENLTNQLDDHRARAAMIWILGEYAADISGSGDMIDGIYLDDFVEETPDVQLALLTAIVKFSIACPGEGDEILQKVMTMATNQIDSPDVRDRAYMYYRMLTECGDVAESIIFPEGQLPLTVDLFQNDQKLVERLVTMIGTIAVLYGKLPQDFVEGAQIQQISQSEQETEDNAAVNEMNLPILVSPQASGGLEIKGLMMRIGDNNSFALRLTSYSETPFVISDIAFNRNIFGFAPGKCDFNKTIGYNQSVTFKVPIIHSNTLQEGARPDPNIDIAIKVDRPQPIIFQAPAQLEMILVPADAGGKLNKNEFLNAWKEIDDSMQVMVDVDGATIDTLEVAKHKMAQNRLFFSAKHDNCGFFTAKTIANELLIAFIVFEAPRKVKVSVRMANKQISPIILNLIVRLLK